MSGLHRRRDKVTEQVPYLQKTDLPDSQQPLDPLGDILKEYRLRHTAGGVMRLTGPWGMRIRGHTDPTIFSVCSQIPCWLMVPGHDAVKLARGDIALLTRCESYAIASSQDTHCEELAVVWEANLLPEMSNDFRTMPVAPLRLAWGGTGAATQLLALCFPDGPTNPLYDALPDLIVLGSAQLATYSWLQPTIEYLTNVDDCNPGFSASIKLISELLFVTVLRQYLLSKPQPPKGWLRGLSDIGISRALRAIHARPGAEWTVASLAKEAGLSRTTLATRFTESVGITPIEYLTRWRMHIAAERIVTSRPNLSRLAFELGYGSDSAFREAFKRRFGISPSNYRSN